MPFHMAENMFGISKRFHAFYCHALFFFPDILLPRQPSDNGPYWEIHKGSQQSLIRPFRIAALCCCRSEERFFLDLTGLFSALYKGSNPVSRDVSPDIRIPADLLASGLSVWHINNATNLDHSPG